MGDNVALPPTGVNAATREVSYSGQTAHVQTIVLGVVAGADDAKTLTDVTTAAPLPATITNGAGAAVDGVSNSLQLTLFTPAGSGGQVPTNGYVFNGTTWDRSRGDATTGQYVGGAIAHDAADSGNPVKTGGVANNSAPTNVTNGDRVNSWYGLNGAQMTAFASGSSAAADGVSNSTQLNPNTPAGSGGLLPVNGYVYNGTTWDRIRGTIANGVSVDMTRLPALPTTGTITTQNDAATSATLLASDAVRKGFRIWNDSTVVLYLKYGTTASATDWTAKVPPDGYFEENSYSGRVDGIWAADASGAARVTALT